MASKLAIYYTPMHFMWGVKSGATPEHPVYEIDTYPCPRMLTILIDMYLSRATHLDVFFFFFFFFFISFYFDIK